MNAFKSISGTFISTFTALIVPETCLVCSRKVERQGGCCFECWRSVRFISPPYCPVMGKPFELDHGQETLSGEAISNPPPFERLRASVIYNDVARRLVSAIKYSDRTDLVPWVANWMRVAGRELLDDCDLVVPVPLHSSRLIQRRFNQSAELARAICSSRSGHYVPGALVRKKRTRQQVGLSERDREANVAGAFVVPNEAKSDIKGRRILVVDDVYTTGATSRAATRALKRAGAEAVDVLVFAKVENDTVADLYADFRYKTA